MTDFKQAFIQGQTAVHEAIVAKNEIDSVFERLIRDVADITDGTVWLKLEDLSRSSYADIGSVVARAARLLADPERTPTDLWITARNKVLATSKPTKLALVDIAEAGYPVCIRYGRTEERCHDKVALEGALAAFLSAPSVAERLMTVAKQSPQQINQVPNPAPSKRTP